MIYKILCLLDIDRIRCGKMTEKKWVRRMAGLVQGKLRQSWGEGLRVRGREGGPGKCLPNADGRSAALCLR